MADAIGVCLLALPVEHVVAVAVENDRALGAVDDRPALAAVETHSLAAPALPGDGFSGVPKIGDDGVVELPVVLELVAAAGRGDGLGVFRFEGPAADVHLV